MGAAQAAADVVAYRGRRCRLIYGIAAAAAGRAAPCATAKVIAATSCAVAFVKAKNSAVVGNVTKVPFRSGHCRLRNL
jgi:hypothetical protein